MIGQGLRKSMAGKWVGKTSRQEVCVDKFLQMSEGCGDIVHAPQKVTSEKEEFNHQANRMTHPLDIQPLSQAIPVIAQWADKRVAMVTEMGVMCGLADIDFPSPRVV